jgi:hypothetical protein
VAIIEPRSVQPCYTSIQYDLLLKCSAWPSPFRIARQRDFYSTNLQSRLIFKCLQHN